MNGFKQGDKKVRPRVTEAEKFKKVLEQTTGANLKKAKQPIRDFIGSKIDDIADKLGVRSKLLGGEGAIKAPVVGLKRAKNMKQAGHSADDIWKKTGWEKGTDGKWKFEIDDNLAKLKNTNLSKVEKLDDILDHPELYEQYPEIKNIKVRFDSKSASPAKFNEIKNTVVINPDKVGGKTMPTLLHEIQHNIQKVEGFAKGGTYNTKYFDLVGNKIRELVMSGKMSAKEGLVEVNKLYKETGYGRYKKLAGEIEARNVETRLGKTNKPRPGVTEDIARSEQIINK